LCNQEERERVAALDAFRSAPRNLAANWSGAGNSAFGLPEDYSTTYPARVRSLSVTDVEKAAKEVVHPDQLVWVVVGDRSKVESSIRDLGWGEVHVLDADGNPAKSGL